MARHRSGSMFRYFRIYRSLLLPRFYQEISSQKTRTAGHFQISRKFSAPQAPGQRQRKEKQRVSGTSNEVSAKPNPREPVLRDGTRLARAGKRFPIPVGTYSEDPRLKQICTHVQVCAQRLFFWTVHGPFSFRQDEKKMGGGIALSRRSAKSPLAGVCQKHPIPGRAKRPAPSVPQPHSRGKFPALPLYERAQIM